MPIKRIALCTMAAPWAKRPMLAVYWPKMAAALKRAGAHTEIFYIGMRAPRFLEPLSAKARLFNERPDDYEYQGVQFHSIRGYYPHPVFLRWKVSPRWPHLGAWSIKRAVFGRLMRRLEQYKPDALLVHDGILLSMTGAAAAERLSIPFAVIEHDPIDFPGSSPLGQHYSATQRKASAVFAVQAQSVRHMLTELRLPSARLAHNGTTMPTDEQRRTPRPEKWRGKTLLLHCGNYIPRKAHDLTIRAFAKVAPPQAHLLIVGPPPEPISRLVADLHLQDRVEFLPWMSQDQIVQHMIWADLFVLPSWWEAFGMVYTEAMAAETPVIMCSDCGLANYIRHGVHGWVIPPKDEPALEAALREALTRADLDRMGRAGRALVEARWTWDRNAQVLLKGLRGEPEPDPLAERFPLPPEALGDRVA